MWRACRGHGSKLCSLGDRFSLVTHLCQSSILRNHSQQPKQFHRELSSTALFGKCNHLQVILCPPVGCVGGWVGGWVGGVSIAI